MTDIETQVLEMFNEEVSREVDDNWNEILFELDSDIFGIPGDDFHYLLDCYEKEFKVDLSNVNWAVYFPWENTPLFQRWFKLKREDVESTRLPLTVRMFAESAAAGRWLYD